MDLTSMIKAIFHSWFRDINGY